MNPPMQDPPEKESKVSFEYRNLKMSQAGFLFLFL